MSIVGNYRTCCQVVTVDMRNHGDSPYSNSMTYVDMAADLMETIRKHQKPKTILMGHSMGGKAAMLVALQEVSVHK
jgi:esterase